MADLIVKINTPVSFNDASTNATAYSWDFGDGNTSIEKDTTHSYSTIGIKNISHVASNACPNGISTCTGKTIEVIAEDVVPKWKCSNAATNTCIRDDVNGSFLSEATCKAAPTCQPTTPPKSSAPIIMGASLLGLLWMFKK